MRRIYAFLFRGVADLDRQIEKLRLLREEYADDRCPGGSREQNSVFLRHF
jgi:hypothetical protein